MPVRLGLGALWRVNQDKKLSYLDCRATSKPDTTETRPAGAGAGHESPGPKGIAPTTPSDHATPSDRVPAGSVEPRDGFSSSRP